MNAMLDFDDSAARGIERIYLTPDVVGQRMRFLDALGLRPGERVLDIGIGPGLLAYDMAMTVGERGRVAGVDLSDPMIAMTQRRCEGLSWTDFQKADACQLPFDDQSFDAVVSTQVYEYVPDMPRALAEVHRVLRPGGRVLILDTDWDSVVWRSSDRDRMARVLGAWDEHLHDPHLPVSLPNLLRDGGFRVARQEVIPILNSALHPHCYSFGIQFAIHAFVSSREGVSNEEADAWLADLRARGESDEYFFSINRYLFGATRS